ncbi:Hypp7269 [Branchiostoma lanceolatum]|uniref:Hypp7269 protein n=1 Tax=Branchiostoma lanceolatum TaxID=7740 RepID=A0A8J9YYQ4_BRALA|nr:Hypp7269 [Branchiostoma lanceolatum]
MGVNTGSIGYNTSRALADLLAPLVGKSVHHIKNSKHLAEEMSTILIEEDDMFLSHDVVSLFTNTPIPETLDIIRRRLQEDRGLKNRTNLQVDDILELLSFIVTTTYFSFRGNIYQQNFGTAMVSPVSPVLANLFMEWLEQQAMATVPVTCRPKLWKRYVDDVMEVVKRGAQQELTDHLNNTDPTGNIQFTYEEEEKGTLPFLDTLLVRKGDGSVKLLVYRKSTHTDQYLNFQSHHPLHQKLGVIRTLMDRCNAVVTEDQDKELETQHIKRALMRCGYPEWTFQKVEQQRRRKQTEKTKTSKQQEEKAKGMVIIPYIKGVTEPLERMFRKHNVATAVRPKTTLRSLLVHPKDKVDDLAKTDCVYKVPCASCEEVYIGETGRTLGTRLKEHQKEATDSDAVKYTRSQKRQAQQEEKKSAISDHVARNNCVIDWEGAKVIDREDNRRIRWIKEAVWIRKSSPVMNRDEGGYKLSHVWDYVLAAKAPPTSATYSGEKQYSSQKL